MLSTSEPDCVLHYKPAGMEVQYHECCQNQFRHLHKTHNSSDPAEWEHDTAPDICWVMMLQEHWLHTHAHTRTHTHTHTHAHTHTHTLTVLPGNSEQRGRRRWCSTPPGSSRQSGPSRDAAHHHKGASWLATSEWASRSIREKLPAVSTNQT